MSEPSAIVTSQAPPHRVAIHPPSTGRRLFNVMSRTQQLLDDPRQFRRSVIIVLSIAFLARFAVLAAFWPSWDWHNNIVPDQWNELAINLAEHRTFAFSDLPTSPTVMRGPLFPFFEVPLYLIFGENYVGWVITLLTFGPVLLFWLVVTVRNLWGQRASLFAVFVRGESGSDLLHVQDYAGYEHHPVRRDLAVSDYRLGRNYFSRWVPLAIGVVSGLMILNKTALPARSACSRNSSSLAQSIQGQATYPHRPGRRIPRDYLSGRCPVDLPQLHRDERSCRAGAEYVLGAVCTRRSLRRPGRHCRS